MTEAERKLALVKLILEVECFITGDFGFTEEQTYKLGELLGFDTTTSSGPFLVMYTKVERSP